MPPPDRVEDDGRRSPLRLMLDGAVPVRAQATPLSVFDEACRWYMSGQRIEISALATATGVSRMTLHRWVGTRDELLTEVMWALCDRTLTALLRDIDRRRIDRRVAELLGLFVEAVAGNAGFQRMHRDEPEVLVRLCTLSASTFQRRLIDRVTALLEQDRQAGRLHVDLDDSELAYAAVRLCESYAHAPAITGEPIDAGQALRVLHALIR